MTRLVLLHGSLTGSARSWGAQRELAARFELVAPDRPGFYPGPPVARVDFEADVRWLRDVVRAGDHLVAHSYGAVIALVAAPSLPLASLVVIEPPAFSIARGEPVVESWLARAEALPRTDPRTHAAAFLRLVGAPFLLPQELPPDLEQGVEALFRERHPVDADVPLAPLPYPVLVVTGDHEPAFDAVGDVLERELGAERIVLSGGGHAVQSAPGFNEALLAFLRRA
ncbi:MAG TPA: alpha/beta hydrolase [Gaiellaceae bacterium]|nr:alpha/beta hydrolase [Gaiellaceae bacterium]